MDRPSNLLDVKKSDALGIRLDGHIKIVAYDTSEEFASGTPSAVLVNKRNAIHKENASILLARAIAGQSGGAVYSMHFGRGGATVDPTGLIVYATPNTTGSADLNTPVYFEVVDADEGAPTGNSMAIRHINGTLFSDVEIRCVLDKNEPFGQEAFDNVGDANINTSNFTFSEIGLKTNDDLLVTHVVFSPVEKSANRIIEVVYTIRVRIT